MAARGWKLWDALGETLEDGGLLDRYDLIFLDTPPALGYLTINGLAAADILLVPLGASFLEFDSDGPVLRHAAFHLPLASKRARTSPPARWAGRNWPSNGMRCAPSSPAMTAASRPNWRG